LVAESLTARSVPDVEYSRVVAYFLHVRCRKPASRDDRGATNTTTAAR
jgi:hypothetical protein